VVVGLDIGTTATKATAVEVGGRVVASAHAGYPLDEPRPGEAVQSPELIVAAVRRVLEEVVASVGAGRVAGVGVSSAMHSLLAVDAAGRPLTPSITWADERAAEQAERLRVTPQGRALHRRTGTPVHAMSPLVKLLWFREHAPEVMGAACCWMGIKEHVVEALTGERVVDHSIASGMGMLDLGRLAWDAEALGLAGISAAQLPVLVATRAVVGELRGGGAVPVVVGAGDGPLANLGVGAVRPGVAACSIGTSGAVRVAVDRPRVDEDGRLFCYALTEERWLSGGAINNGGVVLRWLGSAFGLGNNPEAALLEVAASVPAGSDGLVMLPQLYGERAPQWSAWARGAYLGLTHRHGRPHLVRAALEGVCLQMAVVLESVRAGGAEVCEVRATGGFARSPLWRQMLTDALGMEVRFPEGVEGSSRGAALLAMVGLGLVDGLDEAGDGVSIAEVLEPDPRAAEVYAELRGVVEEARGVLAGVMARLRRVDRAPAGAAAPGGSRLEALTAEIDLG
jgi:gluconokinase